MIEPWLSFLRWQQDAFVFQDMTVPQIVEAVFDRYTGNGALVAAWRWELADKSVYRQRSLCIQYHESDLAFVSRLLAEEGMFYWFEHEGEASGAPFGSHVMVIADSNAGFAQAQPAVLPFTQSGSAALEEDGLQRWESHLRVATDEVQLASHDYRSLDLRPVTSGATQGGVPLEAVDVPTQYAYEDLAQGQRLADAWMQALQAPTVRYEGRGTVRTLGPAQTFSVSGHFDAGQAPFVGVWLRHQARSNLGADARARLDEWLGELPAWAEPQAPHEGHRSNHGEEPLYVLEVLAQPASVAVRAGQTAQGLHPKPTVQGWQSAIVVGVDGPVHTDRDHRIKVQFHWQRGGMSSHGLEGREDNAPASDGSGTWVRVGEALAGANWGTNFVPRLGQEVMVGFDSADIDRPVVIGALYNGAGQSTAAGGADGQGNQVGGGNATSTGNAPAWFPGQDTAGDLQGHGHDAVLSGYKSQELQASGSGTGGYNQLVMDSTPGAGRIELSTTVADTRLQLGSLAHQDDNRRLDLRGHGFDLQSAAFGALRAAGGLILSADGHVPSTVDGGQQMDSQAPQQAVQSAQALQAQLAELAQQHQAQVDAEPEPKKLPSYLGQAGLYESLQATEGEADDGSGDGDDGSIGGGLGERASLGRPDLVLSAPGGIGWLTPGAAVASAGATASLTAGQDLTVNAQRHIAGASQQGLVWFTQGQAPQGAKPNAETGIKLHAASGSLSVQAAGGQSSWIAQQDVTVDSAGDAVQVGTPQQLTLAAGGSSIVLASGSITLTTSGAAQFNAATKQLTGADQASVDAPKFSTTAVSFTKYSQRLDLLDFIGIDAETTNAYARMPYTVRDSNGNVLHEGMTDHDGQTERFFTSGAQDVDVFLGEGEWMVFAEGSTEIPSDPASNDE